MARKKPVKKWSKADAKACFAEAAASSSKRPMKVYGECMGDKATRK